MQYILFSKCKLGVSFKKDITMLYFTDSETSGCTFDFYTDVVCVARSINSLLDDTTCDCPSLEKQVKELFNVSLTYTELKFILYMCTFNSFNYMRVMQLNSYTVYINLFKKSVALVGNKVFSAYNLNNLILRLEDNIKSSCETKLSLENGICLSAKQCKFLYYALSLLCKDTSSICKVVLSKAKYNFTVARHKIKSSMRLHLAEILNSRYSSFNLGVADISALVRSLSVYSLEDVDLVSEITKFFVLDIEGNFEVIYLLLTDLWDISIDINDFTVDKKFILNYAESLSSSFKNYIKDILGRYENLSINMLLYSTDED